MDIEAALLNQNLILGRIEGSVIAIKDLQVIANGRTGKLEHRLDEVEKKQEKALNDLRDAYDKRVKELETEKAKADGRLQAVQWVWGILIVLVGIAQFIITRLWG